MSIQGKALALVPVLLGANAYARDGVKKERNRVQDPVENTRAASESNPPNRETYIHHVFHAPGPELKSAAGAGISQAHGTPYEWGGGVSGYARRLGSTFGKHIVKSSIQYGVAKLRHEEFRYRPSCEEGFRPRLRHAVLSPLVTYKTTTGERTVSSSEISGVVGSGMISRLWQPASLHTIASGFGSAGVSLGADAGLRVVQEFWPEIRHPRARDSESRPGCEQ